DILAKIKAAIAKDKRMPVALSGLGGIGKTQLMLQYCYMHRRDYQYMFWLEAESRTTIVNSYRKLAENLGLDTAALKAESGEKIVKRVHNWLEQRSGW